jgi:tetratricopeptide (TPR) repeat protein
MGKSKLSYLLYTLLISSFIQCVYGQLQLWGILNSRHSLFNITGSFLNPAPYAGFLTLSLPIAILLFLMRHRINTPFFKKWNIDKIAFITVFLILTLLPAANSRAAWLAASFIIGMIILQQTSLENKIKKISVQCRFFLFTILFVVAITVIWGMFHLKKDSANGRLFIWKLSAQLVKEKPFFGSGVDSFQRNYMFHQASCFYSHPEHPAIKLADNVAYVYNEPYKVLIELGIIGLFLIICIGICVLLPFGKTNIRCKIAQKSLLALFIFGLFSYPSSILLLRIYMILLISMIAYDSLPARTINIKHTMIYCGVLLLGFLLCAPFIMSKIKTYHIALQNWRQGVILYHHKEYFQSSEYFSSAFPTLQNDGIFLIQYGKTLSFTGRDEYAITILNQASQYCNNTVLFTTLGDCYKKTHQYQKAENAYLMAFIMVPNRVYPLYLLAKLYKETGQSAKFRDMADRVLNMQPKVQSKAVDEMKIEIQQLKNDI